jgi:putative ABC transport system permease protein
MVTLRGLAKRPGFSAAAILVLAMGIGAVTAVFSLIDAVLLRPPEGITGADRLVAFERMQGGQLPGTLSYPDYLDYRDRLTSFEGIAAEARTRVAIDRGSRMETAIAALVSPNYFDVLGVKRWSGDPPTPLRINGHLISTAGGPPARFHGTVPQSPVDLWLPIEEQPAVMPRLSAGAMTNRASGWIRVFGRLKPGVTLAAAQAEVNTVAANLGNEYPMTNQSRTIHLVPGVGMWSDDRAQLARFLDLLLACVGLMEVIACANVANLLLARAASRRREIAIRVALGASRVRLWRWLVAEGLVLWGAAGALGLWIAPLVARLAVSIRQPAYAMRGLDVRLGWRVALFALVVTLATGVVFSSAPLWQALRSDLGTRLKPHPVRGALIAAQVALALVLLAGAGSVLRALQKALSTNPVSHSEQVTLLSYDLSVGGFTREQAARFYDGLLAPGRALASTIPPQESASRTAVFRAGEEPPLEVFQARSLEFGTLADSKWVSPGFFGMLGIPLVAGRDFAPADRVDSVPVAIVNRRLAALLWPGRNPIGQRLAVPEFSGPRRPPAEIVGVVADTPSRSLLAPAPLELYRPVAQGSESRLTLAVRGPAEFRPDSRIVPVQIETLDEHIAGSLWRQRIAAGLLGSLGLLAALLVAIGLYGVVAHWVTQRTREIGIRVAIGAQPGEIMALVIRESLGWVLAGLAIGLPAALLAGKALEHGIPGVRSYDLAAAGGGLLFLIAAAVTAAWLPARRASALDPLEALRRD